MAPRFVVCQLCGQQFGSASISIHVPQCHSKMQKRWENQDPRTRGPPPPLPTMRATGGASNKGRMNGGSPQDTMPIRGKTVQPVLMEYQPVELSKCRVCGRGFSFDRLSYHESVCKGNRVSKRKFNSCKQRLDGFDSYDRSLTHGCSATMKSKMGGYTTSVSASPPNKTNWRQAHNEFQRMIRDARMYSTPQTQAPAPPVMARQPFQGSTTRNTVNTNARLQQAKKEHYSTMGVGGRARGSAMGRGGSPGRGSPGRGSLAPTDGNYGLLGGGRTNGQMAFGGTVDRWGGRDVRASTGGGGRPTMGGGRILNSNECSDGMKAVFGCR
eukprot:Tbor_TRINITY_DN3263_c0_g1::TRINITY_DN3263_c0_g1_i1::g.23761::m.23761